MTGERRKGLRGATESIAVRFFDEVESGGREQVHQGLVENCSSGGMYIATDHPSGRGRTIRLTFQLDAENSSSTSRFEVRATVRWVRQLTSPKGMGVEFLEYNGISEKEFKTRMMALSE